MTKRKDQIFPEFEDWPIYKLTKDRNAFVNEIVTETVNSFMSRPIKLQNRLLSQVFYKERARVVDEPWKVDPPNEASFWKKMQKNLVDGTLDKDESEALANNRYLFEVIIRNYAEEIAGKFKIKTFKQSRTILYMFFNRLLNTAASRNFKRIYSKQHKLHDRIRVFGPTEKIRKLAKNHTLVIIPTHFSNLDSILLGYALDFYVGLPSFSYGAGLNLFNSGFAAYFMNRLGAYRVDRRKKNLVYIETLKSLSKISVKRKTNSLFFPGGTRSRFGQMEQNLKLGLLSSTLDAQLDIFKEGRKDKVVIVPLVMSYNFVLEAKHLIEQHLKNFGEDRYLKTPDASHRKRKILKYIWQFFSMSSDITLSLGDPIDVLGHRLDENGNSLDQGGEPLDLSLFFHYEGKITKNKQRDAEYTRHLASKIVDSFYKDNIMLISHFVAFGAFEILKSNFNGMDLFALLRLPSKDMVFEYDSFLNIMNDFLALLKKEEQNGKIKLEKDFELLIDEIIVKGISKLGIYHSYKPLVIDSNNNIKSEDLFLLFYYHNRSMGYEFENRISWEKAKIIEN